VGNEEKRGLMEDDRALGHFRMSKSKGGFYLYIKAKTPDETTEI